MINPRSFVAAICAVCLTSVAAHAVEIAVSGSTTVASAVMTPMEAQIEQESGVSLNIVANGSSRGVDDLVNGRAVLAMISAPLDVTIAKINKKAPGSLDGKPLQGHQIGETRVSFVVHPSNPVTSLTLGQVADILSGKTTDWSQLGGPAMPIIVLAETAGGGVRSLVESKLLKGESVSARLQEFPNATTVPTVAAQMPNAFGIAAQKAAEGSASRVLETDAPIAQPLILVTMGPPSTEAQRVIDSARAAGS